MYFRYRTIGIIIIIFFLNCRISYCQENTQLKEIYDSYISAVKNNDFNKIFILFTSEVKKEISLHSKSKKGKSEFIKMSRYQIPESYEILLLEPGSDGKSATLHTISQLSELKEIKRERSRIECDIKYKLENGDWKIETFWFLSDPDKIIHPADYSYNPKDADDQKDGNIGGRIVKTEFHPDHTIVLIRVLDEENIVFLPSREELIKNGYSINELEPWNIIEVSGNPHKTDKLRFFGKSFKKFITPND